MNELEQNKIYQYWKVLFDRHPEQAAHEAATIEIESIIRERNLIERENRMLRMELEKISERIDRSIVEYEKAIDSLGNGI